MPDRLEAQQARQRAARLREQAQRVLNGYVFIYPQQPQPIPRNVFKRPDDQTRAQRARRLLQSVLSDGEWDEYERTGAVTIRGKSGNTYTISASLVYAVGPDFPPQSHVEMRTDGRWHHEMQRTYGCIVQDYTQPSYPEGDIVAAKVLMARHHEQLFVRTTIWSRQWR